MSGHSKWANIKHRKEKTDSQRGKIFTKIGREIVLAVREGGSDPSANGKLRDVIAKAKANNMPNDNIDRSIKKAAGELGSVNYEEITYEGYAQGGVAVIVEVVTDNRNRTAGEIRHIFDKFGNSLGASGCVSWMFDKKGVLVVERSDDFSEDDIMLMALEAGADDMESQEDYYQILTDPANFHDVREKLEQAGLKFLSAEIEMIPQNVVEISDEESIKKIQNIIDKMEDHDDVQNVYHNAQFPDE